MRLGWKFESVVFFGALRIRSVKVTQVFRGIDFHTMIDKNAWSPAVSFTFLLSLKNLRVTKKEKYKLKLEIANIINSLYRKYNDALYINSSFCLLWLMLSGEVHDLILRCIKRSLTLWCVICGCGATLSDPMPPPDALSGVSKKNIGDAWKRVSTWYQELESGTIKALNVFSQTLHFKI